MVVSFCTAKTPWVSEFENGSWKKRTTSIIYPVKKVHLFSIFYDPPLSKIELILNLYNDLNSLIFERFIFPSFKHLCAFLKE